MTSRFRIWAREHPLLTAAAVVVVGTGGGLAVATATSGKLQELLWTASLSLLFGALFGGVAKFLIEDVQRAREERTERTRFVAGVLHDLDSVYDRVERVRILIAAHKSAKTYGNEMRELIDSAVRLRNVKRALAQRNDFTHHARYLNVAITSMERYLNSLIEEFKDRFKSIADKQRIYEASFSNGLKQDPPSRNPPPNSPWEEIRTLPRMAEFRQKRTSEVHQSDDYRQQFTDPLGFASWVLNSELVHLSGRNVDRNIPEAHLGTQKWLDDLSDTLAHDRRTRVVDA